MKLRHLAAATVLATVGCDTVKPDPRDSHPPLVFDSAPPQKQIVMTQWGRMTRADYEVLRQAQLRSQAAAPTKSVGYTGHDGGVGVSSSDAPAQAKGKVGR